MLGAVIVLAVVLFYSLQKYVVTTADGVSLDLPFLSDDGSAGEPDSTVRTTPKAELVIDEPDYENIDTGAGEGIEQLRALFVGQDDISADGLAAAAEAAESMGTSALVLDMKPAGGLLSWNSYSATAASYGTAGSSSLTEPIASLKDGGFYLAAQISVCADDLIASRNPNAVLTTPDGATVFDSAGGRLDPYNSFVRTYILELLTELDAMGFDEVILTNLSMPAAEYVYSQEMAYEADAETAILSFSNWLIKNTGGLELTLSAVLDGSGSGQNEKNFFMMFDRVCYPCASGEVETKRAAARAAMTSGDAGARFVPISASAPESGSWIVKS